MPGQFATAIILVLAVCTASLHSNAQSDAAETNKEQKGYEENIEGKIDQLDVKIEKILSSTTQNQSIFIEQPLASRRHGVEFNFFRLIALDDDSGSLSGGYSFFDTDRNVEFAFPFLIAHSKQTTTRAYYDNSTGYYNYSVFEDSYKLLTQDFHYRQYLRHRLDGFYISAFTRAAILDGVQNDGSEGTELKWGLGVGIGYRVISNSGLYWGASLNLGRYLLGDSDKFSSSDDVWIDLEDNETIVSIELLKFGYAF